MDSISSYEFHTIFNRTSDAIDLQGKLSVEAIERALVNAREQCKRCYSKAETARERARIKSAKIQIDNLLEHGFAQRTIHEAVFFPRGLVALTLRWGKKEAKRLILAQRRAQIRGRIDWQKPTSYRH